MDGSSSTAESWSDPAWLESRASQHEFEAQRIDRSLVVTLSSSRRIASSARRDRARKAASLPESAQLKNQRDGLLDLAIRHRLLALHIQLKLAAFNHAIANLHAIQNDYETTSRVALRVTVRGTEESTTHEAIENIPDYIRAALHAVAVGTDELRAWATESRQQKAFAENRLSQVMSSAEWAIRCFDLAAGKVPNHAFLRAIQESIGEVLKTLSPDATLSWRKRSMRYLVEDFRQSITPGKLLGELVKLAVAAKTAEAGEDLLAAALAPTEDLSREVRHNGSASTRAATPTSGSSAEKTPAPAKKLGSMDSPGFVAGFRGSPDRTGEMPGPGPSRRPRVRWKSKHRVQDQYSPAVAGRLVYTCGYDSNVYAFDRANGRLRWRFDADEFARSPVVVDGWLYVGTFEGSVFALDAQDAKVRWRANARDNLMPPVVDNGTLYLGARSGSIYAFDAQTGAHRWRYRAKGGCEAPAIFSGVVYGSSEDRQLFALDAATGEAIWRSSTVGPTSTPAVADGVVIVSCGDAVLSAFETSGGRNVWNFNMRGESSRALADRIWSLNASPAVSNGVVYCGCAAGHFYAVDARTGRERWRLSQPDIAHIVRSSAAVVGGTVYFGCSDGFVVAVDAKRGRILWKVKIAAQIASSPVIVDGMIYIVGDDLDYDEFLFALGS